MLTEYVIEKVLDAALARCKKLFTDSRCEFISAPKDIHDAIASHVEGVSTWSEEVSFLDLKTPKHTRKVFVDLELFLYPRRTGSDSMKDRTPDE